MGFALRLNRAWLFRVRQTAEDGRAAGLWSGFNDLSVFRLQYYSAHHIGNRAYRYSLLRQNVGRAGRVCVQPLNLIVTRHETPRCSPTFSR